MRFANVFKRWKNLWRFAEFVANFFENPMEFQTPNELFIAQLIFSINSIASAPTLQIGTRRPPLVSPGRRSRACGRDPPACLRPPRAAEGWLRGRDRSQMARDPYFSSDRSGKIYLLILFPSFFQKALLFFIDSLYFF